MLKCNQIVIFLGVLVMNKIELLAPAGNLERLKQVVGQGQLKKWKINKEKY